jgi:hypothetical protein
MQITSNELNDFDGIEIIDILQHRCRNFIEVDLVELCSDDLIGLIGMEMNARAVEQILEKLLHFKEICSLHIDSWDWKNSQFLL